MEARSEAEVFEELADLCRLRGYVHVIAYFSFRDNLIRFGDQLDAKAMESQHAAERLVKTEIATLIGLMVQGTIDATLPAPSLFQEYIDHTQALLKELHWALSASLRSSFRISGGSLEVEEPVWVGPNLREPIFYSADSAYGFQYRDLAIQRYAADNPWLLANKGFEIQDAVAVAEALADILSERQMAVSRSVLELPPDQWTMLPGFVFSVDDIQACCAVGRAGIEAVLAAFTLPRGDTNLRFTALQEFNAANVTPLLHWEGDQFVLLQHYSLLESIYESPIFWMRNDRAYGSTAIRHRGSFTESFAADCLEKVFGAARVLRNVDIYCPGRDRVGEIDALAVYGSRAILVQAKSKSLTIEARKGNDLQIKNDFKLAVQDAADQAFLCATALLDCSCTLKDAEGGEIDIPRSFDVIQPLCVVSDHYPSLAFQARQFLHQQNTDRIKGPLVTDVFALDVMAEMLPSPLHFLHYLTLRTRFDERLSASHELTLLAYHLKYNLWFNDDFSLMHLEDDLSLDLDVAMLARREGLPGAHTPEGILTRLKGTTFGQLVRQIESSDDPSICELGLLLLQLGEETARSFGTAIDSIARAAARDRRPHDLSLQLDDANSGLTVHCRYRDAADAMPRLLAHCQMRKYASKSDSWYGLLIDPDTRNILAGVGSREAWAFDAEMEELLGRWPVRPQVPWDAVKRELNHRIGRNGPCPCGSGKKYKKCCLQG